MSGFDYPEPGEHVRDSITGAVVGDIHIGPVGTPVNDLLATPPVGRIARLIDVADHVDLADNNLTDLTPVLLRLSVDAAMTERTIEVWVANVFVDDDPDTVSAPITRVSWTVSDTKIEVTLS